MWGSRLLSFQLSALGFSLAASRFDLSPFRTQHWLMSFDIGPAALRHAASGVELRAEALS